MRSVTKTILKIIKEDGLTGVSKDKLKEWVKVLTDEIKINESCNLRITETDKELRLLCRIKGACNSFLGEGGKYNGKNN